jgi:alpha-L-fucosidase 2
MFFKGMLDVSAELGTDAARREKWQHILTHLSDFPTAVTADGVRRVRGAEDGPAAKRVGPRRGSTRVEFTGMVWPSGVLGMGSPPALLKVLQDDVREWPESEWINHYNGFSQSFPGAARVGHDPLDILTKLRQQLGVAGYPNLMVFGGGGGIENCSGVPATINEMLVQSHAGVMRVFPVWPKDHAASFGRLRTDGAFLVSSALRGGEVQALTIESEKGRECVVQNPWPGHALQLTRNGKRAEVLSDECLRFKTAVGECITLQQIAAATTAE